MMESHGPSYVPEIDGPRLKPQRERIRDIMLSASEIGTWHTLLEIHHLTNFGEASISAQLRNLRKEEFGGYVLDKRPRGDRSHGLWEYKLTRPVAHDPKKVPLLYADISVTPINEENAPL